ncbi:Hypothetical predicted protein [Marmota monax]|uniref:Uncharacterized protein n=1 Tax=Marmota monax TaxID=9995 RepID=A0A5E4B4J0_MARMO|nr:Hypothetical predicted protein [Marmota monax]
MGSLGGLRGRGAGEELKRHYWIEDILSEEQPCQQHRVCLHPSVSPAQLLFLRASRAGLAQPQEAGILTPYPTHTRKVGQLCQSCISSLNSLK